MHTIERQHRPKECIVLRDCSIGRKNAYYRETSAVIWGKLACPSERVQRARHSACALNGHASFSQIMAEYIVHIFPLDLLNKRPCSTDWPEKLLTGDGAQLWVQE
ncbi:MAG: hypothetical protein FD188_3477 [Ignavibacteria bacterium]|nr:MAG: hypothetical protein FD188_3477 [Ignavibacteria bacterium]